MQAQLRYSQKGAFSCWSMAGEYRPWMIDRPGYRQDVDSIAT